jgi:hypothetical protein
MHWPVRNWDDVQLAFPFRPEVVDRCGMSEGRVTRVMIWSFSKANYCPCTHGLEVMLSWRLGQLCAVANPDRRRPR